MNSGKHSRASLQRMANGPLYHIEYIKGERVLRDCAGSLEAAQERIRTRLAKRHNRGEAARVYFKGEVVFAAT